MSSSTAVSGFKESWLIPKKQILDYWESKTNVLSNNDEGGTGIKEEIQEGGNALLDSLEQYKPSKRLKIARFYNKAQNMRTGTGQGVLPNPYPPPTPKFADANTEKNKVQLSSILQYFPEAERYKVMSLLNYINQYLLYRFTIDSYLNIIIDRRTIQNSSIVDILRYLFGIERFYVTDHKVVIDPQTDQKYGIPRGTEEFVEMLKKSQKNLRVFGISGHRLRLLNVGTQAVTEDEDEGETSIGGGDNEDRGDGGVDDDDNDDDDGGDEQTPYYDARSRSRSTSMRRRLFDGTPGPPIPIETPGTIETNPNLDDDQPIPPELRLPPPRVPPRISPRDTSSSEAIPPDLRLPPPTTSPRDPLGPELTPPMLTPRATPRATPRVTPRITSRAANTPSPAVGAIRQRTDTSRDTAPTVGAQAAAAAFRNDDQDDDIDDDDDDDDDDEDESQYEDADNDEDDDEIQFNPGGATASDHSYAKSPFLTPGRSSSPMPSTSGGATAASNLDALAEAGLQDTLQEMAQEAGAPNPDDGDEEEEKDPFTPRNQRKKRERVPTEFYQAGSRKSRSRKKKPRRKRKN